MCLPNWPLIASMELPIHLPPETQEAMEDAPPLSVVEVDRRGNLIKASRSIGKQRMVAAHVERMLGSQAPTGFVYATEEDFIPYSRRKRLWNWLKGVMA